MAISTNIYYPATAVEKTLPQLHWQLSDTDCSPRTEIILPKGTVEIIFNFSDAIRYNNSSQQIPKKLPVALKHLTIGYLLSLLPVYAYAL